MFARRLLSWLSFDIAAKNCTGLVALVLYLELEIDFEFVLDFLHKLLLELPICLQITFYRETISQLGNAVLASANGWLHFGEFG